MRTVVAMLVCAAGVAYAAQPGGWAVVRGKGAQEAHGARIAADGESDALVESAPVSLAIGKRYELSARIRTEGLEVRDAGRTPVAIGAAVAMASMPFDVHSEAVGGTRPWTRVRLRFTATRAQDRVLLTAGLGGRANGRAWFDSVSLEELAQRPEWPSEEAVESYGPAYRYPAGSGWIYLHIQGQPYERGYQHGHLMAAEIPDYLNRCAMLLDSKSKERAWDLARTAVSALFLRGFDREILEEMRGIAEGASAAGAKWNNRAVDLLDIATANTFVELGTLESALPVTPTGLEGLKFTPPRYADKLGAGHCSAFAATGKATRGGKMVIGHITMWPLRLAEASNVMLDIQPAAGHRMLIQSYAGGIESGLDWYQNDAGIVLAETTIRQSPFNAHGTPIAYRARKAIQYGDTIDKVVETLGRDNNGLYTNEWLIGDAKNDEIAMYELGTYQTKLWRSSKNQWFGGTEGFYWGCNNAKDLQIRLEYQPDPKGAPAHIPFVPAPRDLQWQELYARQKGQIDEQFGFLAFRTAPLVSSTSMDAKVTNSDMANHLMVWAVFGKPNQREWIPRNRDSELSATGIYAGGYRLIQAPVSPPAAKPALAKSPPERKKRNPYQDRLWQGWILPASDADLWLSAGSAEYYRVLKSDEWEKQLEAERSDYSAARARGDKPLRQLVSADDSDQWYSLAAHKGALLFDALRREIGDDKFLTLMRGFFAANATRPVASGAFLEAAEKAAGRSLAPFFHTWLDLADGPAPVYSTGYLLGRLRSTLIVYGTTLEAGANRYAAEQLQERFLDWFESAAPLRKDFEVSSDELQTHDVVFIGRPEANSALAAWQDRIGLKYDGAAFQINGIAHTRETEALALAAPNPLDAGRMVVVIAGNSPLETVRMAKGSPFERAQYVIYRQGRRSEFGFLGR